MPDRITKLMQLLQFTDSALPVGAFSFSNGMETAALQNIVRDADTLEAYVSDAVRQAAFTDGIAALHAFRSRTTAYYDGIINADRQLMLCKMNTEARQMLCRMGKKLAELSTHLIDDVMIAQWLRDIEASHAFGTYPVAQGILFAACGLDEEDLFSSHQYGVAVMILNAALRCVRVSHYQTQHILFRLGDLVETLYEEARQMDLDEMYAFAPQIDIIASMHEKGSARMFMN